MPSRNVRKVYVKDSYYHIYNRGVEKRIIFQDEQDYKVFLKYLKEQLSPLEEPRKLIKNFTLQGETFKGIPHLPKNFSKEIELCCFALMPNHFHLLVKQLTNNGIEIFTRSILTRYSMYFNKKYRRVGTLFQGTYKAVMIMDDPYFLHLSRYIHQNPSEYVSDLTTAYSSYADYLGLRKTPWVKPEFILKFFNQASNDYLQGTNTYKDFVEKYQKDSGEVLGKLVLE